jgi:biotin transport system substrate-specific component
MTQGFLVLQGVASERRALPFVAAVALGVFFLFALAQLRVQIGPVPVTGQTLGVLLLAAAGGRRFGLSAVAAYLLLGFAGLPLFSGLAGGVATLSGTTVGYLIGFLPAALLVGFIAERFGTARIFPVALAMLAGSLVVYLCGVTGLLRFAPDLATAIAWGVTPFLIGDALKVALATALLPVVTRLLGRS